MIKRRSQREWKKRAASKQAKKKNNKIEANAGVKEQKDHLGRASKFQFYYWKERFFWDSEVNDEQEEEEKYSDFNLWF